MCQLTTSQIQVFGLLLVQLFAKVSTMLKRTECLQRICFKVVSTNCDLLLFWENTVPDGLYRILSIDCC